jgi:hypothetical protein
MASSEAPDKVLLDLNNPTFQAHLFGLEKTERHAALDTLNKIRRLTWAQLYRDNGIKWEKIVSVRPPARRNRRYLFASHNAITQGHRISRRSAYALAHSRC